MTRILFSFALFYTLPFLIEGVCGLEPRQIITPTADPVPLPESSPILIINDPTLPTACTFTNITWVYAGIPAPLALSVTDFGVPQDASPPSISQRPTPTFTDGNGNVLAVPSGATEVGITTSTITQGIDPRQSIIPWVVNVPSQRWYRIMASIRGQFLAQSHPFYVQSGPDIACLPDSTPTPGSTPTPTPLPMSTPASSPSPTIGGINVPDSSASSSPSSSNSFDTGAIVGIVVGAVALIAIVLMVYLCLRRRKNALDKPTGGQFGGAKLVRGWGGLGSIDSNIHRSSRAMPPGEPTTTFAARNVKRHSASESFGHVFAGVDRSGNASPLSSTEEKFSTSPASYGRNPFDDAGGLALATLPSSGSNPNSARSSLQYAPLSLPQQSHGRTSSTTVNTFTFPQGVSGSPPGETLSGAGRRPSADSISYPPTSPPSAYQFYPSSVLMATELGRSHSTSSSTGGAPPSSHSSLQQQRQKPDRHSASTQSVTSTKKTPRKPVPAYDPSHPSAISTSTSAPTHSSPSPYTPTGNTPAPTTPTIDPAPLASSSGQRHYAKKPSPATNAGAAGSTGELVHKSSFRPGGIEGKPLHYLIPDMPLAQND